MSARRATFARLIRECRRCAAPVLALALLAIFAPHVQAGVIVEMGAAEMAAASVEPSSGALPNGTSSPSERKLCPLSQDALYGQGGAAPSAPQSGSSTSAPSQSPSAALAVTDDAVRAGGQWRSLTELDEPRLLRGALDSVFHPPRAES